jgi:hypothetical protein
LHKNELQHFSYAETFGLPEALYYKLVILKVLPLVIVLKTCNTISIVPLQILVELISKGGTVKSVIEEKDLIQVYWSYWNQFEPQLFDVSK